MPYKKRYNKKKKRRTRRKPKQQLANIHRHIRDVSNDFTVDLSGSTYSVSETLTFNLTQIAGYSELTAIYDQYTIDRIYLKLMYSPLHLIGTEAGQSPNQSVYVMTNVPLSRDGGDTPSLEQFKANPSSKLFNLVPGQTRNFSFKPNVLTMLYEAAASTAYGPKFDQWINIADETTPHHGFSILVEKPVDSSGETLDLGKITISAKFDMRLKNPH